MDALELQDVSKVYEVGGVELVALAAVDLTVADCEVVTLLGPSGSGKTTLLSIAGGLLSPSSGRVIVGGQDITHASARQLTKFRRKKVGFIFQGANLVPFLTARENLVIVSELSRRDSVRAARRAEELLDRLGMSHRMENLPGQLSGGERQRVAIGRALMNEPTLVLVDEPTSALDSRLGEQVMELIVSEVKARNAAAVVVTHDQRMTRYGDRILTMADGRIASIQPRPEWTTGRRDLSIVEADTDPGLEPVAEEWPGSAMASGQAPYDPDIYRPGLGAGAGAGLYGGRAGGRADAGWGGFPQRGRSDREGGTAGEAGSGAAARSGGRPPGAAGRAGDRGRGQPGAGGRPGAATGRHADVGPDTGRPGAGGRGRQPGGAGGPGAATGRYDVGAGAGRPGDRDAGAAGRRGAGGGRYDEGDGGRGRRGGQSDAPAARQGSGGGRPGPEGRGNRPGLRAASSGMWGTLGSSPTVPRVPRSGGPYADGAGSGRSAPGEASDPGSGAEDRRSRSDGPRRPEDYVRRSLERAAMRENLSGRLPRRPGGAGRGGETPDGTPEGGWGEFADLSDDRGLGAGGPDSGQTGQASPPYGSPAARRRPARDAGGASPAYGSPAARGRDSGQTGQVSPPYGSPAARGRGSRETGQVSPPYGSPAARGRGSRETGQVSPPYGNPAARGSHPGRGVPEAQYGDPGRGDATADEGWPMLQWQDDDGPMDPVADDLGASQMDTGRVDPVDVARAAIHRAREQAPPPRAGSPEVRGSDSPRARRSGPGETPFARPAGATPPGGNRRPAAGSGGQAGARSPSASGPSRSGAGRAGGGSAGAGLPQRRPPASPDRPPRRPPASADRPARRPPAAQRGSEWPADDSLDEQDTGLPPRGRSAWAPAPPGQVGSLPPAPEEGELRQGRRKRRRFSKGD